MRFLYNEFTKLSTGTIILIQWLVHGDDIIESVVRKWGKLKGLFGFAQEIERRLGGDRRKHMTLSEILKDAKLAESLAPQVEAVWKALDDLYAAYETQRTALPPAA
jgi:hypothetical protein